MFYLNNNSTRHRWQVVGLKIFIRNESNFIIRR